MEPPVVTIVSYSSGGGARERMDKGTIEKTYEDLIRLVGSDQFICLICERRAVAFGGKAAKILSCKSSGNITVHIAACCPDELTEAHAEQHKTIATRYFAGKATGAGTSRPWCEVSRQEMWLLRWRCAVSGTRARSRSWREPASASSWPFSTPT